MTRIDFDDERLPDLPAQPSRGHHHSSLCEHYQAGAELGWLCGELPMFSASAGTCPDCELPMLPDSLRPGDELTLCDDGELVHLACCEAR